MQAFEMATPSLTLILRSTDKDVNLLYLVEIEAKEEIRLIASSENYIEALMIAKKVFNKLKEAEKLVGDFAVMIEAEYGRGVSYEINDFQFHPSFEDSDRFYQELCNEFEAMKLIDSKDLNKNFRIIVNKEKLNEYQELRFLNYLKKLGNV